MEDLGFKFSATFNNVNDPPPRKPPDDGGQSKQVSFRDKLLGYKEPLPIREKEDLFAKGLVRVEYEGGNRLFPKVHVAESYFSDLCAPWHEALVIKLLGKTISYAALKDKLRITWRLQGDFDLMDVCHGFYMVKFDQTGDREKVINDGPWMIYDHYLAVSTWSPSFVPEATKVDRTMVWVRFPGLNLAFYDESFLLAMASAVGRPVKVDSRTLNVERGRFARVCVEIDLNQPVVGKVWLHDHWYKVEYEGLHIICNNCGCYGHHSRTCTNPRVVHQKKPADPVVVQGGEVDKQGAQQCEKSPNNHSEIYANSGPEIIASDVQAVNATNSVDLHCVEPAHGNWLVVTRKKKIIKNGPRFQQYGPVTNMGPLTNHFDALSENFKAGTSKSIAGSMHVMGENNEKKNWVKNKSKRLRDDFGNQKLTNQPSTSGTKPPYNHGGLRPKLFKDKQVGTMKILEGGINTTMPIQVVKGNHLRFTHEESSSVKVTKPPPVVVVKNSSLHQLRPPDEMMNLMHDSASPVINVADVAKMNEDVEVMDV